MVSRSVVPQACKEFIILVWNESNGVSLMNSSVPSIPCRGERNSCEMDEMNVDLACDNLSVLAKSVAYSLTHLIQGCSV